MRDKVWKYLIMVGAALILLSGGCQGYKKANYAADASFVINDIALYRGVLYNDEHWIFTYGR